MPSARIRPTNIFILLGLILVSACMPNTSTEPPTSIPATSMPIVPTQTEPSFSSSEILSGEWIGAVTKPDGTTSSVILKFDESKFLFQIEPLTKIWDANLSQNNGSIEFSVTGKVRDPFKQIVFTGALKNGVLTGEINWDDAVSSVSLTPIVSVDVSLLEKYEGVYRFESGRALSIIISPEYSAGGLYFFSKTLMLTDFESGALRGLYPFDDYTFAVGALRVVGAPFAGRIQFITDDQGNTTGLMWWDDVNDITPSSTSGQFAGRVQYKYEEITFTSADGIKLAGSLSLPDTDSPAPAFMMMHGSEQGMHDNFGNIVMMHYMISNGIAILNYDKRGVGGSDGVYQEAASAGNLQRHAEDAIAGVEYLASRPEIDVKRIGLIGFSQAGWVIPLAASQSALISHIVILSGPVESTLQEDVFSSYTNDGDTATNYDDANITQKLRDLKPGGFDPIPIIAELNVPGLWLWGSVDKSVPVTFSAENLQALIDSGKTNFSYEIFPNGDHNLNLSPNGLFAEIPYSPGVLFYSTLADWLEINMLND
jgi:dienelactone hydrolase